MRLSISFAYQSSYLLLAAVWLILLNAALLFAQTSVDPVACVIKIADTDRDGLPDVLERVVGFNPKKNASNGKVSDGERKYQNTGKTFLKILDTGGFDDIIRSKITCSNAALGTPLSAVIRSTLKKMSKACKTSTQKNCRWPLCSSKIKKNCRKPTPKASVVVATPTPRPTTVSGPGATPTVRPTVRPTNTPAPSGGNFDANGNTTKFGIPAGLTGNISAGASVWASSCNSCHGEKPGRTFQQVKGSLMQPFMMSVHVSDSQVANVVAYLNRLNR